jgi:hypothetical protein
MDGTVIPARSGTLAALEWGSYRKYRFSPLGFEEAHVRVEEHMMALDIDSRRKV